MSVLLIGRELICPYITATQAISYEFSRVISTFSNKQVKILTVIRQSLLNEFKNALANTEYFPTTYINIPNNKINIKHDLYLLYALNKNYLKDVRVIIDVDLGLSSPFMPFLLRKSSRKKIRTIKIFLMKMNMAHIASSSHYNYIMATSPSLFRMIKWFPLLREKVHYVPPPIDITCFSPENKKDQLYYNDLSQTIISYIGPINPKRFALIETLKAVNLLAKKIDFVFTIYTFFRFQEDENTYHFLEKIIDKLHLRKNVKIKNVLLSKDEKARIFRNSSLCLYPIRSFELADPPISILEAMASGSIVATSPINGIPLVLKNNFNGFLINELKTNYLSDLIQHIVECPEKKEIKRNASKTISDHFSYDYVWKKLSELIDE